MLLIDKSYFLKSEMKTPTDIKTNKHPNHVRRRQSIQSSQCTKTLIKKILKPDPTQQQTTVKSATAITKSKLSIKFTFVTLM